MAKHIALPQPLRGNTHIRVGRITEHPASSIELRFVLGTENADGAFVPDPFLGGRPIVLSLDADHAAALRARAADAGAPTGPLGQEWRLGDLWAYLSDIGFDPASPPSTGGAG